MVTVVSAIAKHETLTVAQWTGRQLPIPTNRWILKLVSFFVNLEMPALQY